MQTYQYRTRWRWEREHGFTRTVDPARVVEHVHALEAQGWSQRAIADAADCAVQTVNRMSHRSQSRIHRDSAAKILAVTPAALLSRTNREGFVLSIGSKRRVQALLAIGHRHADITAAMHGASPGLRTRSEIVLHQVGRWITRGTHEAICTAYDQLAMTPGASGRTRARAAGAGYAPPLAWDDEDLDDPYGEPVAAGARTGFTRVLPPVEELQWLLEAGESIAAIASRFGVSEDGVSKALGRHTAA